MEEKNLKIFIVNLYFPRDVLGGSEIQCWLLAKYLPSLGHKTTYITLSNPRSLSSTVERSGVKIEYLGKTAKVSLRNFINFYRLLKRESPDICYLRTFRFNFNLAFICWLARIPAVFNTSTLNDCLPLVKGRFKLSLNPWQMFKSLIFSFQHYLNFVSFKKLRVVTINKEHARLLAKRGVRAVAIYNSMEDPSTLRRGSGQAIKFDKKNQVVWVNNIKRRKNPESYLKLVKKFKDSDWKFLMIGHFQGDKNYYMNLIREIEAVNHNFVYLGGLPVEEVDGILARSKIFVNTCGVEGFGNNFIQAWLAECPTITLNFDPDDIIKNNGLGFHSKTQEQMEKDLGRLMADEDLRFEMGKRARKWAKENHDINKNKLKYEKIFKDIINDKKA